MQNIIIINNSLRFQTKISLYPLRIGGGAFVCGKDMQQQGQEGRNAIVSVKSSVVTYVKTIKFLCIWDERRIHL